MFLTARTTDKARRLMLSLMMPDTAKRLLFITCATASVLFTALLGTSASAQNFVQNGNFTSFISTGTSVAATGGAGQLGYNTNLANWTVANNTYNFVFLPKTIDKTGTNGASGALYMAGPNNGNANGLTGIAPTGGNILAADGAYEVGAISQNITGLTAGKNYVVSFDWGGAQQYNYSGATTEQWKVMFDTAGATTPLEQDTAVLSNASQGFTGWQHQNFVFKANSTSQVLSFLAVGAPGQPPFSLLSGVSVTALPEPGAVGFALTGIATSVLLVHKRKSPRAGKPVSKT